MVGECHIVPGTHTGTHTSLFPPLSPQGCVPLVKLKARRGGETGEMEWHTNGGGAILGLGGVWAAGFAAARTYDYAAD